MSGKGRSSCPFYEEIDAILGTRAASQPVLMKSSTTEKGPGESEDKEVVNPPAPDDTLPPDVPDTDDGGDTLPPDVPDTDDGNFELFCVCSLITFVPLTKYVQTMMLLVSSSGTCVRNTSVESTGENTFHSIRKSILHEVFMFACYICMCCACV